MAKLLWGGGTEPAAGNQQLQGQSYTLVPVSLQRYSTEGKFVGWISLQSWIVISGFLHLPLSMVLFRHFFTLHFCRLSLCFCVCVCAYRSQPPKQHDWSKEI